MKLNRRNSSKSIAAGASMAPRRSFGKGRTLFGAALSIATLTASLAAPSALHAQSLSLAGVESTVPVQGLGEPTGITMDQSGNLYIADNNNNRIVEITPQGVQSTLNIPSQSFKYVPGGPYPQVVNVVQLAVDGTGNLFILDNGTSTGDYNTNPQVKEYTTGGTVIPLMSQGLGMAGGLTIDSKGNVIASNATMNQVYWFPYSTNLSGGGGVNPNDGSVNNPTNMAMGRYNPVTQTQYLFIADAGTLNNSQVYAVKESFSASGPSFNWSGKATLTMPWPNGLNNATGVAVDSAGNVFVTDTGNNRVVEWPLLSTDASGNETFGSGIVVGSGFSSPYGLTVDAKDNLYIADRNNSRVVKLQTGPVSFGAVNACPSGQTSPAPCSYTLPITFNVIANTTLGTPQLYTEGVVWSRSSTNTDFALASGGTCTGSVTAGSACTVNVTFNPRYPGLRTGSLRMVDSSGNVLAAVLLSGVGQAPLAAFQQGTQVLAHIPRSYTNPTSVVVDPAGNFYVAQDNGTVTNGNTPVGTGLGASPSLALDGNGTLYIADPFNNRVVKVPAKAPQSTIGSGFSRPTGVAVDGQGNVYIADALNNRIVEVNGITGAQSTVVTGLNTPEAVAVDGLGDIYIADSGNSRVVEVSANGTQTTIGSGLVRPWSLTVDAGGDVYVADEQLGEVFEITPSGRQITVGTGLQLPSSLALDGAGDLFIADYDKNQIIEIEQSQAQTLSFGSLPANTVGVQSMTVQNIGNQPLDATGLSVSNSNFEQVAGSGALEDCWSAISLAGGADCNLSIMFAPSSTGSFSGSAVLTDNSSNSTSASQTIKLTGSDN